MYRVSVTRVAPAPLPDLSIRQLEYLLAVAGAPNWATAAQQCGVTASALSQGLAELERRVGVSLFDRQGRRRVFRDAATPVLAHARQVVTLTADLAGWVERTRRGRTGQLRVGMIDAAAVGHYAGVLRDFGLAHGALELRLRVAPSGPLLDELEAGEIDVVLCVDPGVPRQGINTEELMREDLAVFTPSGTLSKSTKGWGPWVLFSDGSHTRAVIDTALRELGAPLDVVAESNQPEVLRTMVGLGIGSTVLPVVQAGADLGPGRIIADRRLVIATRHGAVVDPAAEMFVAALRGHEG